MERLTIIESGQDRIAEFGPDTNSITIGRAPENHVQILEKRASRQHVRIERLPDATYRLTDLGSANGTRLNGDKVTESVLRPGDKIEIGETALLFGETSPASGAATVEEVEATVAMTAAVPESEAVEKPVGRKTTNKRRRTTGRRKKDDEARAARTTVRGVRRGGLLGVVADLRESIEREIPHEYRSYLAAGLGLVVAIPVLFLMIYGINRLTASDETPVLHALFDQGVQAMDKGDQELDSAKRLSALAGTAAGQDADRGIADHFRRVEKNYKEAEKNFAEVARRNIDPGLTKESQARIDRMKKTLEQNATALKEIDRIKERVKVAGLSATQYLAELRVLEGVYGDTVAVGEIRRQMEVARSQQNVEIEKEFAAIQTRADQETAAGRYFEAIEVWRDFAAQYDNPDLDRKVEDFLRRIDDQAVTAYGRISGEADRLADTKRFDEARRLFEEAITRFRGTSVPFRAKEGLAMVDLMVREGLDRSRAQEMIGKQKVFRDKAQEADQLARAKRYEAAMALFEEVIDEIERTKDRELAELAKRYEARISELRKIVALIENLKESMLNRTLATWSYTDRSGMVHTIESADDKTVQYSFHGGQATVPRRWNEHDAVDMYHLFRCMALSAADKFALAIFCFDNDLLGEGHALLVEILREDPKRRDDVFKFYSLKSGKEVPEGGFVVHDGRLMSPLERDRHEDTKKIDRLVSKVGVGDAKTRQETFTELEGALADAERKYGASFVAQTKLDLVQKLMEKKQQLLTRLQSETSRGDIGSLRSLKGELEKRRAHALELIFDEQKYPYDACHGCEAQPEVDKRVEAVREVWDRPAETARTISPDVGKATDHVTEIDGFLSKVDPGHSKDTAGMDLEYVKSLANKRLDIKNFGETSGEMKKIADSNKTMDENGSKQTVASGPEKDQMRITNEYRVMMGKGALRIDDRLVQAARGHSEFMQSSGQFDHVIPGHPNGASPQERAKKEGYPGAVGENIYMGSGSPQAAHDAWVHSSGHHRNILRDGWKAMGAGNAGKYWTQNFGNQ